MKEAIVTRQGIGLAVALIGMTMVALLAVDYAQAGVCEIVNGSFEDDGYIANIVVKEPNGWDVNVPAGKFKGIVDDDWATDGDYSLTLRTEFWKTFIEGDMATVFQQIDLTDANEIIFDLKLEAWNPDKVAAIVLIDDDIVWDSNSAGLLTSGVYRNRKYIVEDKYRGGNLHRFTVGIKVNVSEMLYIFYITKWDYIRCTGFCGDGGLLAGDFDHDCFVDINDMKLMADVWLGDGVEPDDKRNLFTGDDTGGFISFPDFAVFADSWDGDIADLQGLVGKWLQPVSINDQYNLYKGNDRGIINFFDFAVFAENWLKSSYE